MSTRVLKLIETLRGGARDFPRRKELLALSGITPEAQSALREAWPHIPLLTRRQLVAALGDLAEADATATFEEVFLLATEDPDEEVRLAALRGLWDYDEEAFVPTLIQIMDSDSSAPVRAEAAITLGKFAMLGELEELEPETTDLVRRALIAVWNSSDEDVEVRRRALESVACLTSDEIPDMILAAYGDKDERMNVSAVYAMGRALDEAWAPYILNELKSPRPEMRYEAARAAGQLQLTDAIPLLLDLVHDADADVRTSAILALGDIGGERAIQTLLELAKSTNASIREAALDALDIAEFAEDPLTPLSLQFGLALHAAELEEWDEEWDEELDKDMLEALGEDWEDEDEDEDEDDWEHDSARWN